MGRLDGKVVIVTGSSAGIGRATALLFAQAGASVTIHGRSSESLQKTADLLKSQGTPESRILIVQGVVEDEETSHALINKTVEKFGRIDVLVNNAGIGGKVGLEPLSMENFKYVFDVNLKSVVLTTQLAVPHLEKTKGNIVNVSSIAALKAGAYWPYYNMAKAALDHFARCYSLILAPKGIRINTLNPGGVDTEFGFKLGMTQQTYENLKKDYSDNNVPLRRFGEPEEMAKTIYFLATDGTYITGANIVADGGTIHHAPLPKLE